MSRPGGGRRAILPAAVQGLLILGTVALGYLVWVGVPIERHLDAEQMKHRRGHAYSVPLEKMPWLWHFAADGPGDPRASVVVLTEDGRRIGPPHSRHVVIRQAGRGRYSHWQDLLLFSASDNSDPRTNGRRYTAILNVKLEARVLLSALLLLGLGMVVVALWWWRRGLLRPVDFFLPLGFWAGTLVGFGAVSRTEGVGLWLVCGVAIVALIWAITASRRTWARGTGRSWRGWGVAQNGTLAVVSVTLVLAGAEGLLTVWERRAMAAESNASAGENPAPKAGRATGSAKQWAPDKPKRTVSKRRKVDLASIEQALQAFGADVPREVLRSALRTAKLVTMPPEFQRTPVEVEGAIHAFRWHGVVHVQDIFSFRRTTPFPARDEQKLRVMVVGDSLTYGDGIDEPWTYARRLEALLGVDHSVEVLNLGVSGHQSEDILAKIREFLPVLRPDIVVYGVCVNDFLPSRVGQYQNNFAYAFPLPEALKTFLTDHSRLARLSEDGYNRALLQMGLRVDFFDDILHGFSGYQSRFARDVAEMNELVIAAGLPPMVGLGLDQSPLIGSRGHQIIQVAEEHLRDAGFDVVETAPYYEHLDGFSLRVSRWEGHPNEAANAIWAEMLNRQLRRLPVVERYRKSEADAAEEPAASTADLR